MNRELEFGPMDSPVGRGIVRVFEGAGAIVRVGRQRENLVRTECVDGVERLVVEAQGFPNLVHEFVHAVHAGGLAEDHGFDYGRIPLDLHKPADRATLVEELCACWISCELLDAQLRRGAVDDRTRDAEVFAWFAEQAEIQPVFYGDQNDLPGFVARVSGVLDHHGAETRKGIECAWSSTCDTLARAGVPRDQLVARWSDLEVAWRRFARIRGFAG